MGGKAKSPDPVATSTAQEQANQVNTSNPFASTNYAQTGTNASGVPVVQATTQMAPELQSLYSQVGQSNPALTPYALSDQFNQQQGASYKQQMGYLQPQEQQQTAQLQDHLQQQGITQDSNPTAYANAMTLNNNNQDFQNQQAYNSSYATGLAGENLQFNQGLQESNLPISQLTSLYALGDGASMGSSTTLAQLAQQQYQEQLASQNNTDSGLTGLAGSGLMAYAAYAGAAA